MKVVILGCGRVGCRLANWLAEQGSEVAIVDKDEAAFQRLGEGFSGETILGNPFDEEILRSAFKGKTDVFISVAHEDNMNIMMAQVAKKKYGVPRVIARITNPALAEVYRGLGLEVMCPTDLAIMTLKEMLALKKGT